MPRKKSKKKKPSQQPQTTPLVPPPFEELPPAIQAAIKAKGWTYPRHAECHAFLIAAALETA